MRMYRKKAGRVYTSVQLTITLSLIVNSGIANYFLFFICCILHIFITSLYNSGNKEQQQQNPIKFTFKRKASGSNYLQFSRVRNGRRPHGRSKKFRSAFLKKRLELDTGHSHTGESKKMGGAICRYANPKIKISFKKKLQDHIFFFISF